MKRKMLKLIFVSGVMFVSTYAFATSIEMVTNQSAKFWVNSARYATTDGADTAYYNPAGTAFMQEGTYFSISSQTLFIPYDESIAMDAAGFSESYSQDNPILVLPNIYLVSSLGQQGIGNLSLFCNAGVIGGGGSLEWDGTTGVTALGLKIGNDTGSLLTKTDVDFNASAAMYQLGAGAAYSLNNMVSFSAGARYVIARKEIAIDGRYTLNNGADWTFDIDYETELAAEGYCLIFGIDVKPVKDLNMGIKYESETGLRYKYDHQKNKASETAFGGIVAAGVTAELAATDGTETDADFPSLFSIGAEYNVTGDLMVSASSVFYFMGSADMDGVEDYYKTGYDVTIGTTYRAMDNLKIGTSLNYTTTGAKDEYYEADGQMLTLGANPPLDWVYISGGATYNVTPDLDITGSAAWIHYLPKDVTTDAGFNVKYEKEGYVIALEAGYKI